MIPTAVIVDDNMQERDTLAGILSRIGVQIVEICESGPEAMKAILRHRPTIAAIDNNLGGMSGTELMLALKPQKLPTTFVMCSGATQSSSQNDAISAGATLFIGKPYDNIIVRHQIKSLLGLNGHG